MSTHPPYIGITGFTHPQQVERMLEVWHKHLSQQDSPNIRHLHVGVMMSYETLHNLPTEWATLFPRNEAIEQILYSSETYNCLHYADYKVPDPNIGRSLRKALSFGGENLHAIQLDMVWPDPNELSKVKFDAYDVEVILQIGRKAFESVGQKIQEGVQKIGDYEGVIDRVLIDMSGGEGKEMNPSFVLEFMEEIAGRYPRIGLVGAGGLGPHTLDRIRPVIDWCPSVSFDAQAKLCIGESSRNPTNWDLAEDYLDRGLREFP